MIPIDFPGTNLEMTKPRVMTDEQCLPINVFKGIDIGGFQFYMEAWKPSYEDIQAINRGEPIYIKIIHNVLPPIAMWTMDENNQPNI